MRGDGRWGLFVLDYLFFVNTDQLTSALSGNFQCDQWLWYLHIAGPAPSNKADVVNARLEPRLGPSVVRSTHWNTSEPRKTKLLCLVSIHSKVYSFGIL